MKKSTFIILLIIEVLADLIAMAMLMSDLQAFSYLVGAGILAVLMLPFFLKLKKTEEESKKAKIRRNLILVLLLPFLVGLIVALAVVVALSMYFG